MGRFYAPGEDTPSDGGGGGGMSRVGCCGANGWVKDVKGGRSSHQLSVWSVDGSRPTVASGLVAVCWRSKAAPDSSGHSRGGLCGAMQTSVHKAAGGRAWRCDALNL